MIKKLIKNRKGQALVEFALILPLLLLIILGIVEFGRIFGAALTVQHSAREGARLGVIGGSDTEIITTVKQASPILDINQIAVQITPEEGVRARGQELSVEVRYPVQVVVPFVSMITGNTVTVHSVSVMRME